jgi:hypothetical protein
MVMKIMKEAAVVAAGIAGAVAIVVASAAVLVVLGLVFFIVNLWIVKTGAGLLSYTLSGDWAVFAASILTAAGIIGSGAYS